LKVNTQIKIGEVVDKLYLPNDAVMKRGGEHYCCVHQDGLFKTKKLKTGSWNSRFVEIVEGLRENEEVLRNATSRIDLFDLPNLDNPSLDKSFNFATGINDKSTEKMEANSPKDEASGRNRSNLDPLINQMMTRLDANKNGYLDKDELEKLVPNVRERLLKSDATEDGKVSRSELIQSMEKARGRMNRSRGSVGKQ